MSSAPRRAEEELLAAALRGDRQAFGELAGLHQPRALALATGLVGNREDARDLVQDACLKAFRAIDQFVPGRPFFPWYYRILRNACVQHLRGRRLRRTLPVDGPGAPEEGAGELPDAVALRPEELLERDEHSRKVGQALANLPPQDREILLLKHFNGLSYQEIADALSVPAGTVMSRLHAARTRLRKLVPELA